MINVIPITLGRLMGSWKIIPLNTSTRTNDMLIKGYAKLKSNFVMAAIQHNAARNAERNAETIQTFLNMDKRKDSL